MSTQALRKNTALRQIQSWLRHGCPRELWEWARCARVVLPTAKQLNDAITAIGQGPSTLLAKEGEKDSPIFVLATGWRTGSTLLQRILVTDPRLLLWGEPLGEMTLISEMTAMMCCLTEFPGLQSLYAKKRISSSTLAKSWIGTLYPPSADFREGIKDLLDRWLGDPARKRGFGRWGFKEVRLGATEASFLHWLYPRAKFVVLSRNPFDCYRSMRGTGWHHVYFRRPDVRVDWASGFARHWNRLAVSWSELPPEFPVRYVKYEDIIAGKCDFRELEQWLGVEIRENLALSAFVNRSPSRPRLKWYERVIISCEAAHGMKALGYTECAREPEQWEASRAVA